MAKQNAASIGADLSTTALSMGVRGEGGDEDFIALPMAGATRWHGQPGFHLQQLARLLDAALEELKDRGWCFDRPGNLSFSVRQHDMVLMDQRLDPLMPSLSWECHVAEQEVRELEAIGVDQVVGPIAPRFILPKLMWALRQEPTLGDRVFRVATTGDYIAAKLTGTLRLSASDALSNAVLDQSTKQIASRAMHQTTVSPDWFPEVIPSGRLVGKVDPMVDGDQDWNVVREMLAGWSVAAGLGDNHASAIGCGLADAKSIVISGGSSGTVVRACPPTAALIGKANCFEYFDDRLLLMMLADCAIWYNRFLQVHADRAIDHETFNNAALTVDTSRIQRVKQKCVEAQWFEVYPERFGNLSWSEQVASTQYSIALELLLLVQKMLVEVDNDDQYIEQFVLTGGLCQSSFLRCTLYVGLKKLVPNASVRISDRTDRLAFQSATYGALINAKLLGDYANLARTIEQLCPQRDCECPTDEQSASLGNLIHDHLSI